MEECEAKALSTLIAGSRAEKGKVLEVAEVVQGALQHSQMSTTSLETTPNTKTSATFI